MSSEQNQQVIEQNLCLFPDVPYAKTLRDHLVRTVRFSLEEDIGTGDITAQLIPKEQTANAQVITRETGVLAGREWFEEVFRQVDANLELTWHKQDGDQLEANDLLVEISGNTRSILTAERTALNFLQTLSGTATLANQYSTAVAGKRHYCTRHSQNLALPQVGSEICRLRRWLPKSSPRFCMTCF